MELKMNKQEILEEAAEHYIRNEIDNTLRLVSKYSFKDGAKWQAEQLFKDDAIKTLETSMAFLLNKMSKMYSEEEVLKLLHNREQYLIECVDEFYQGNLEWFNNNKQV